MLLIASMLILPPWATPVPACAARPAGQNPAMADATKPEVDPNRARLAAEVTHTEVGQDPVEDAASPADDEASTDAQSPPEDSIPAGAPAAAGPPATQTQTAPAGPSVHEEISDDPTYLKTSVRGVGEHIEYANGATQDRLRIRYLQRLGKKDGLVADLPLGRVNPGAGFASSYGTGDLSLQYLHVFPSQTRRLVQAAGAILVLKSASDENQTGSSGYYGALYAAAWGISARLQPFVIVQYLHSVDEDEGFAPRSLLQLRPVMAVGLSRGWFATGELRVQRELQNQERWGATCQASLGKQVRHWRTVGGYERALGETSKDLIYTSRIFLEFGYTF